LPRSTVLTPTQLGATKPEQLKENIKALDVYKKLEADPALVAKVNGILDNKPKPVNSWGRIDDDGKLI